MEGKKKSDEAKKANLKSSHNNKKSCNTVS